jgi:NTE family protein
VNVLNRHGIELDMLVGCRTGSIYAALLASGHDTSRTSCRSHTRNPRFSQRIRLFDIEKIPYIIEEGERAAEEQLPYLRKLLAAPAADAEA